MSDLESHWLAERLAYLGQTLTKDTAWEHKVRKVFPRLKSNPKAEARRKPGSKTPFVRECRRALHKLPRSSDLSQSRKKLYRELVAGSASDLLEKRLGWSLEENRSLRNWVPGTSIPNNSPGDSLETRWHSTTGLTERAYQTNLIVPAAAVI